MTGDHETEQRPSHAGQAAKYGAKKAGKSLGKKLLILLGVKGILWVLVIGLVLLVIAAAAGAVSNTAAAAPAACGTGAAPVAVAGTAPGLNAEQLGNAQIIAGVALRLGLGRPGVLLGILTSNVETDLRNLPGGDRDSVGLFQQRVAGWGTFEQRHDPVTATEMFFLGGKNGAPGVLSHPGWETMDVGLAMQQTQQSQFSQQPGDQSPGYAGKLAAAIAATDAFMASQPVGAAVAVPAAAPVPCPPAAPAAAGGVAVALNGPVVTIPDNPNVVAELRGKAITTGSAGIAKGLAAGLAALGMDYVWGGGGDGAGPNNGAVRGGGALNSGGSTIGFDCSGLSAYVIVQGGFPSPGGNSGAQAQPAHAVPWEQGAPGDLIVFPGHVAVFVGLFNGSPYILEASTVGVPIHVVKLTRTDHYPTMYRYWS